MALSHVTARCSLVVALSLSVGAGLAAAPGLASAECVHPQGNVDFGLYGDVNGSGVVNVPDTICVLLTVLWKLNAPQDPPPGCLAFDPILTDMDCSGTTSVTDALISINVALNIPLSSAVDGDEDGCADACAGCVAAGEQSCLISGACVPHGGTTGGDPCTGCDANANPGAESALPDGTVCGPGLECVSQVCTPSNDVNKATNVAATPGSEQATVTWTPPANPSSTIVGYQVTVYGPGGGPPAGVTGAWARNTGAGATSYVFASLTNGVPYQFTVTPIWGAGLGPESALSNTVTPRTLPGVPYNVAAAPGDSSATVSFSAPLIDGGSPITGYLITVYPDLTQAVVSGSPATVIGLINGLPYQFTVAAINGAGTGPESLPSNTVFPTELPGPPTLLSAGGQDGQILLTYEPPANTGGGVIIGYVGVCETLDQAQSFTGTASGAATSVIVPGLNNGTGYVCTVSAINAAGEGPPSNPSAATFPQALTQGSGALVARPVGVLGSDLFDPNFGPAVSSSLVAFPVAYMADINFDGGLDPASTTGAVAAFPAAYMADINFDGDLDPASTSGAVTAFPVAYMADVNFDGDLSGTSTTGAVAAFPVAYMADINFDGNLSGESTTSALVAHPTSWITDDLYDANLGPVTRGVLAARPASVVSRPYVHSVSPVDAGLGATSLPVTLTGLDFESVVSISFYNPSGVLDTALSATAPSIDPGGDALTFLLTVDGGAALGDWTVVVTTGSGIQSPSELPTGQQAYDNAITIIN